MTDINITLEGDDALADLARELRTLGSRVNVRIARSVVPFVRERLAKDVATKLRPYPPRRRQGTAFVWSFDPAANARARRWFFANYPKGRARTGRLAASWRSGATYNSKDGTFTVSVGNSAPYASYVVGSEASGFQQVPGHVTTGWVNFGDVGQNVVLDAQIIAGERMERIINEEIGKL
jgi:hypothetical protein